MKKLENLFVNFSAADVLSAAMPLSTQTISGDADPVRDFESGIANLFGKKHAIAVSSGTVAIYCALYALDIKPGDEVILTPTAVIMSALPVIQLGATVKFADTNPDDFGFSIESLKQAINEKTRAVINVPMWGYPTPMDDVLALCTEKNITLIEDISQSHGTTWNGQYLGTFGRIGCLSTQERKLITTGEGGVVITDDDEVASKITILKRYGLESDGTIGHSKGLNLKMSAFSAAAGSTQISKINQKIQMRRLVAEKIRSGIKDLSWFAEITFPTHSHQNYYALVYRLNSAEADNLALGKHLADQGIISDPWRYHYQPLYLYPICGGVDLGLANAVQHIKRTFTLPCHEGMEDDDIQRVIDAMHSFQK